SQFSRGKMRPPGFENSTTNTCTQSSSTRRGGLKAAPPPFGTVIFTTRLRKNYCYVGTSLLSPLVFSARPGIYRAEKPRPHGLDAYGIRGTQRRFESACGVFCHPRTGWCGADG